MRVLPGPAHPFGARLRTDEDGPGVDFAVFSAHATRIDLCLFDDPGDARPSCCLPLPARTGDVWHGRVLGLRAGQLYGFRAHGPWAPEAGHRFNPHKLLVDPYARALAGPVRWDPALFGHEPDRPELRSRLDSAPFVPKAVVVDPAFDWEDDAPPAIPWSRTVLYECHVKGMTRLHPEVPPEQRGRYLGLAAEPVIEHLRALGVTAVELMPVHHHALDAHLARLGLPNYWGYMTLGFFAPDARFASGDRGEQVNEFREMVKRLHRAGLEVILDVVYNHTPEGGLDGPTFSLRGLDNASYYRQSPDDPGRYLDFTGCGNSLDTTQPRVLQLVLDSLRYWVSEMHVDGFRFDLAPVLARDPVEFQGFGRFFEIIQQDPILAGVKCIAEPWDLGPAGYQLGRFPYGWAEWNGRFRDGIRRFWRGDAGLLPEAATRLAGSSDLFAWNGRPPQASINYVSCHDGMTLRDLVSYSRKHNEPNGENNRDGPDEDSHNWGVEGPTDAPHVRKLRERVRRSLLASAVLAQGVPMLSHGDELGRTQRGNSNAYCQDNELTWVHWEVPEEERAFLRFVRELLALRAGNAVFRRRSFFRGESVDPAGLDDVVWLRPDGSAMTPADWHDPEARAVAMLIPASAADPIDERGRPQAAETVLLLLNGGPVPRGFVLPEIGRPGRWVARLDTACDGRRRIRGRRLPVAAHALVLLGFEAAS